MTDRIRPGVALVPAAALLLACSLRPAEIHPDTRAALALLAPVALAAWVGADAAHRTALARLVPWIAALAIALSLRAASSPRTGIALQQIEVMAVCLVAFLVFREPGGAAPSARRGPLPPLLALAGGVAASVAIWQRLTGFEALARAVAEQMGPFREEALARIASGRVFGTLLLPASLAGLIAIALPAAVVCAADRGRGRVMRGLAVASAALQFAALPLTGSIAGIAATGLALALTVSLAARSRRVRVVLAGGILLAGALGAGVAVARRGFDWSRPSAVDNPAGLRLGNWEAGARMLLERPALGVGAGGYAAFYPRLRAEGTNEVRHAHNSWLEPVVEYGPAALPLLILGALAVGAVWWRACRAGLPDGLLAAGLPAFLMHNVVDFTAYQPGVAVAFAALLGALWDRRAGSSAGAEPAREAADAAQRVRDGGPRRLRLPALLAGGVGAAIAVHALAGGIADLMMERAADTARRDSAIPLALRAGALAPFDPEPPALAGGLLLESGRGPEASVALGKAAALDSDSARLAFLEGLAESHRNRPAAAWLAFRRAELLNPLDGEYTAARRTAESALHGVSAPGTP